MGVDDESAASVPFAEQVGLVLRSHRRRRGWSQRTLAEVVGVSQATIARIERNPDQASVGTLIDVLVETGHTLGVDASGSLVETWDPSDRVARDRAGRRFPAHREVRPVKPGDLRPQWWMHHEYFDPAGGSQPTWTAEGFAIPEGTRYGKRPRPFEPGEGPRWPARDPAAMTDEPVSSATDEHTHDAVDRGPADDGGNEPDSSAPDQRAGDT